MITRESKFMANIMGEYNLGGPISPPPPPTNKKISKSLRRGGGERRIRPCPHHEDM